MASTGLTVVLWRQLFLQCSEVVVENGFVRSNTLDIKSASKIHNSTQNATAKELRKKGRKA